MSSPTPSSKHHWPGRSVAVAATTLVAATVFGCGNLAPSVTPPTSGSPHPTSPSTAASASPLASKPVDTLGRATTVGWVNGIATIAFVPGTDFARWSLAEVDSAGFRRRETLPASSIPVTDGVSVAAVLAPDSSSDVLIVGPDGTRHEVRLPAEPWAAEWRASRRIAPVTAGGGYLLEGAPAYAVIDDTGAIETTQLPRGYVALSATSDPKIHLLATRADGEAPGGLTESVPFAVYAWRIGAPEPALVRERVVTVASSSVGLAWLRGDDGSWWLLPRGEPAHLVRAPSSFATLVSPDGSSVVAFTYSSVGCDQSGIDPCSVAVTGPAGSTRNFAGPALGASFSGNDLLLTLSSRPTLQLRWRAAFGPVDGLSIVELR